MMDIQITDEHLTKLEIAEDSVLLLELSRDTCGEETEIALRRVRDIVKRKTGIDPAVIAINRDIKVSTLAMEELRTLRNELNARIVVINQKQPGELKRG